MCESGILRPFISDHNAVFCVLNDTTVFNDKHAYIKRNFCKRNISKFCKFLKNELWNNIYYSGTQEAFTEFQQNTEEASTPNIGRGAETQPKTTMHSLTTTIRTLPSTAGLQAYGVWRTQRHLYRPWSFTTRCETSVR